MNRSDLAEYGIEPEAELEPAVPLATVADLEGGYARFVDEVSRSPIDLAAWLPSFRVCCRPLVPGDLVVILAATAVGKTAILQNLAWKLGSVPTAFFELELSGAMLFERLIGMAGGMDGYDVEKAWRRGARVPKEGLAAMFPNLRISDRAGLTVDAVERACRLSDSQPKLVLIDYLQLLVGRGSSRYEKFSNIAEDLRRMAKNLGAAVIVISQVRRRGDDESPEVELCDAKESGSIENSASLVLGAWREQTSENGPADRMIIRVLKNSRGTAGRRIACRWEPTLRIAEMPRTDL